MKSLPTIIPSHCPQIDHKSVTFGTMYCFCHNQFSQFENILKMADQFRPVNLRMHYVVLTITFH